MSRFPNRRWLVIPTTVTGSIDFNQVLENSVESLRLSIDSTETFVKYEIHEVTESYEEYTIDSDNPGEYITSSYEAGIYGRPDIYSSEYTEYNHADILTLLATDAWSSNSENTGSE